MFIVPISVPCPLDLFNYNGLMNCEDRFDKLKNTYEIDRKRNNLWHRIFWYIINASVVNAYAFYWEINLPKLSLKEFRRDICRDFDSSAFVTFRNKHQITSRSIHIKNKKTYVSKKDQSWRVLQASQKDPREDDRLLAAQTQFKFIKIGCVVSAKFHCA
ncbi:piggyBac transposable element-derived protein 2 [Trichonephila clavipes]|nr:piggyBac transposable element-derived protein 2 [Trichonephila clavipes]